MSTEQHHDTVRLGGDEPEDEDVPGAAAVALQHGLPQGPVLVEGHLLVLGPHQVVHDVAPAGVAPPVTEPSLGGVTLDQGGGVADTTVGTSSNCRAQALESSS